MNLSDKTIFCILGAVICGIIALSLFGKFFGLIVAVAGGVVVGYIYDYYDYPGHE